MSKHAVLDSISAKCDLGTFAPWVYGVVAMQDMLLSQATGIGRNTCAVSIDRSRLILQADMLAKTELSAPSWRAPVFPDTDDELFVQFLGTGNAINYCYTNFKTHKKFDTEFPAGSGNVVSGAFAMWACLKKALDRGLDVVSSRFLADHFTDHAFDLIFEPATTSMPMRESRIQNLRATGAALRRWYGGKFSNLFEAGDFRVFRRDDLGIIQRLVRHFPSYAGDVQRYPPYGPEMPFHKRARLLPLMYEGRARDSHGAILRLKDPEKIGPVADYDVPKALRSLGILEYAPPLAKSVDEGKPLYKGSIFEIEIRAQTACAMHELCRAINAQRDQKITQVELDYAVWSLGRKTSQRHHYTETTAY